MEISQFSNRKAIMRVLVSIILILPALAGWPVPTQAASLQQADIPPCSGESDVPGAPAPCQDLQVLFIIDDSGSMRTNDRLQARFAGIENTIDILGEVYLKALEAQSRQLPQIYVAAIHFAREVDLSTSWIQINPADREAWQGDDSLPGSRGEIILTLIPDTIRNLRLTSARTTNFIQPFKAAVDLFNTASPTRNNCSNRIVLVLTDGAPDLGNGPLSGELLNKHFVEVKQSATQLTDTYHSQIYISGLNDDTRRADYWTNSEPHWKDIAVDTPPGDQPGAVKVADMLKVDGEKVEKLSVLRDRIQAIIEEAIGLRGETVAHTKIVPPYLESLRISYFAPDKNATLKIIDPHGLPIDLEVDGAGTPDQVIKILNPEPGEYRFEPSEPGGSLRLVYSYPNLEENVPLQLEKSIFQQYTHDMLTFQLVDTITYRQEAWPRFRAHFTQPSVETTPIPLEADDAGFHIPLLPLYSGQGEVSVDVFIKDHTGQECLLQRSEPASFEVIPVTMVAYPKDPQVCTPSEMPTGFNIELHNGETEAPTAISLPIEWQVEVVHENGSPVAATIEPTSETGVYAFTLNTDHAGQIQTSVSAIVSDTVSGTGFQAPLFQDQFPFTHLVQDQFYAFDLLKVEPLADDLSIRLYHWLNQPTPLSGLTLLTGRKWSGAQEVQVSGRFFDEVSGEDVPGIKRYQAALVPAGGGEAVATSQDWQDGEDGEYTVALEAPAFGAYQVLITDQGEPAPCVQVNPPLAGLGILLIRPAWAYLIWLILLLLLIAGVLLIIRYLFTRRKPDERDESEEPDDLKLIEGIGPKVEALLHQKSVNTFAQIADAVPEVKEIQDWLDNQGWYFMLPDTWPEQARLAEEVKAAGEDPAKSKTFKEYKAYLRGGRIPEPNDFERIDGIGPQIEALLKENGIETYEQLAVIGNNIAVIESWLAEEGWSTESVSTWPEQARLAAAGEWQALEAYKRILRGR